MKSLFSATHIFGEGRTSHFIGFLKSGELYYESRVLGTIDTIIQTTNRELTLTDACQLALAFLESAVVKVSENDTNILVVSIGDELHGYYIV